jgi:hypothetical protein
MWEKQMIVTVIRKEKEATWCQVRKEEGRGEDDGGFCDSPVILQASVTRPVGGNDAWWAAVQSCG